MLVHTKFLVVAALLAASLAFPAQSFSATTTSPKEKSFEKIFYLSSGKNGLQSLKDNIKNIDIVAPQAYKISAKLVPSGSISPEIKEIAKNIKIMPLIVNERFSQSVMHSLLISDKAQTRAIDFMVKEALAHGYVGWQFDLEHILYTDRDAYSRFVEKTAKAFKKHGLTLSIAAVARVNDVPTDFYKNWSGAFDYARLAKSVDFISIMTYDDPDSRGPTASMPYVKKVYEYLKGKVPPEKLSLGVPLYGWRWSVNPYLVSSRTTATHQSLEAIKKKYKYTENYNKYFDVPSVSYADEYHTSHIVWHENGESIQKKLDFARENNLRGFSAWVLGLENPKIWEVVKKF